MDYTSSKATSILCQKRAKPSKPHYGCQATVQDRIRRGFPHRSFFVLFMHQFGYVTLVREVDHLLGCVVVNGIKHSLCHNHQRRSIMLCFVGLPIHEESTRIRLSTTVFKKAIALYANACVQYIQYKDIQL